MNKDELIKEHKEVVKSLNLKELTNLFYELDLKDDFDRVVLAMPRLSTLEQLRENLVNNLINWVEYETLTEEELEISIKQVKSFKEEK